jgi:uncharacterized protein involved in exopolysaccharide biosynthesis
MDRREINSVDLFRALQVRRLTIFLIVALIVTAGMAVTFLLPPAYQSTMKILVTRDRIDPQVTAADKGPESQYPELTDEDFNSELEILQSRSVLEGVARQLGLDKPEPGGWLSKQLSRLPGAYRSFHKQPAPDPLERAVITLSERLEAVAIKKSRIIKVSYRDKDPQRAAQILSELYRQYADHHLRLHQASKAGQVFRERSEEFGKKLQAATETLKQFHAANGITDSNAQREMILKQYYEVRGQLDSTRTQIVETREKIATTKAQLNSQPERIESEARTRYVGARDRLKDEILSLEMQRTQLLQKYQPSHRLVTEVEQKLRQARELQAREENAPPQERTVVLNDLRRKLEAEFLAAQAGLNSLVEREKSLAALAADYRVQITSFDAKSLEREGLERNRQLSQEAYLLYYKKAQEADIVNALDQQRVVNISLAEAATINRKPVSPKPLINFAVLLVLGLISAVAMAVFTERRKLFAKTNDELPASSPAALAATAGDNQPLQLPADKHEVLPLRQTKFLPRIEPAANKGQRRTRELIAPEDALPTLQSRNRVTKRLPKIDRAVKSDPGLIRRSKAITLAFPICRRCGAELPAEAGESSPLCALCQKKSFAAPQPNEPRVEVQEA